MKSNNVEFLEQLEKDLRQIGAEYRAYELSELILNVQGMERIVADKREKADLIMLIEELAASNERMDRLLRDAADKMFVLGKENQELKMEASRLANVVANAQERSQ